MAGGGGGLAGLGWVGLVGFGWLAGWFAWWLLVGFGWLAGWFAWWLFDLVPTPGFSWGLPDLSRAPEEPSPAPRDVRVS